MLWTFSLECINIDKRWYSFLKKNLKDLLVGYVTHFSTETCSYWFKWSGVTLDTQKIYLQVIISDFIRKNIFMYRHHQALHKMYWGGVLRLCYELSLWNA